GSRTGLNPLWRFLHWKRWQYASVVGQDCVVAVAIVDLGWAMNAFAYVFDRRARRVLADVSLIGIRPLSGSVADDVTPGAKSTFGRGGARLSIERSGSAWNISVSCQQLKVEATLAEVPGAATICAIGRVPGGVANCTHKSHGLRVQGFVCAGPDSIRFEDSY